MLNHENCWYIWSVKMSNVKKYQEIGSVHLTVKIVQYRHEQTFSFTSFVFKGSNRTIIRIRTILLFWIPQESTWFQTHWIQDVFQFWFFCFRKLEHGRWNWMNGLNPFWFRFCSISFFNFCSGPYLHVFTQQF